MNFRTNVMGDEPYDPLAIGGRQSFAGLDEPFSEPVHPQATIRIEHHLDDGWIFNPRSDRGPKRSAQHSRTAGYRFHLE